MLVRIFCFLMIKSHSTSERKQWMDTSVYTVNHWVCCFLKIEEEKNENLYAHIVHRHHLVKSWNVFFLLSTFSFFLISCTHVVFPDHKALDVLFYYKKKKTLSLSPLICALTLTCQTSWSKKYLISLFLHVTLSYFVLLIMNKKQKIHYWPNLIQIK